MDAVEDLPEVGRLSAHLGEAVRTHLAKRHRQTGLLDRPLPDEFVKDALADALHGFRQRGVFSTRQRVEVFGHVINMGHQAFHAVYHIVERERFGPVAHEFQIGDEFQGIVVSSQQVLKVLELLLEQHLFGSIERRLLALSKNIQDFDHFRPLGTNP